MGRKNPARVYLYFLKFASMMRLAHINDVQLTEYVAATMR